MAKARDKAAELTGKIRDQARLHEPLAVAIVELVRLSHEDVKESLVNAEGNDIHRLQGAARFLKRLHQDLTTVPPNIGAGAPT